MREDGSYRNDYSHFKYVQIMVNGFRESAPLYLYIISFPTGAWRGGVFGGGINPDLTAPVVAPDLTGQTIVHTAPLYLRPPELKKEKGKKKVTPPGEKNNPLHAPVLR